MLYEKMICSCMVNAEGRPYVYGANDFVIKKLKLVLHGACTGMVLGTPHIMYPDYLDNGRCTCIAFVTAEQALVKGVKLNESVGMVRVGNAFYNEIHMYVVPNLTLKKKSIELAVIRIYIFSKCYVFSNYQRLHKNIT